MEGGRGEKEEEKVAEDDTGKIQWCTAGNAIRVQSG